MTLPHSIPVNCLSYQRLTPSNLVSQLPSCVHNNVSLSDADISFVSISSFSYAITSSTTVSYLSFHSMVSHNIPSSLVPAYTTHASSQIPTSQGILFVSYVNSLPNKLSELSFCRLITEVDIAAITEVLPKTTFSVLSPDEIHIKGYGYCNSNSFLT